MNIVENFRNGIKEYIERYDIKEYKNIKYRFLASIVFEITTYDTSLSAEFGRDILEVMEIISKRSSFEYIRNKEDYRKFIIVVNILNQYGWIEWGTSIRGCWFDNYAEPIINTSMEVLGMNPVTIKDEDICKLIEYLKSEELQEELYEKNIYRNTIRYNILYIDYGCFKNI